MNVRSIRAVSLLLGVLPLVLPPFASAQGVASPSNAPLGVSDVTALALAVNPAARSAQQRLLEAQAALGVAEAQGRLQPALTGSAGGSTGRVAQPASNQSFYSVSGSIILPFPNGGRVSAQVSAERARLRAAQADLDRTRLDLIFRASEVSYGVLRARDAQQIAADTLQQAERQVTDTQKRVDAGDIAPAEVLKAQVPAAQARVALARARSAVRIAEQTLNSLIGRDLNAPLTLKPAPALSPLTLTHDQVIAAALTTAPDIRAAQADLDAAQAGVRVTHHLLDPEFSAQAGYTNTSDITAYSNLATVMLSVTFPLGDGGAAHQQKRQAQAQLEQARSALTLAQQATRLAAEQAFLDFETDQANVSATQETVRIAQDSLDKAREAFAAGLTNTRDVLDAQLALAQTRSEANAAVYDLAVARAKLDQVMGTLPNP